MFKPIKAVTIAAAGSILLVSLWGCSSSPEPSPSSSKDVSSPTSTPSSTDDSNKQLIAEAKKQLVDFVENGTTKTKDDSTNTGGDQTNFTTKYDIYNWYPVATGERLDSSRVPQEDRTITVTLVNKDTINLDNVEFTQKDEKLDLKTPIPLTFNYQVGIKGEDSPTINSSSTVKLVGAVNEGMNTDGTPHFTWVYTK